MLNGMYEIYKKKQLLFSEEYCNGKKCGYVSYNLKTGKILEKADYTKKFDQQEHSFYLMFDENEKGEFTSTAYFRKGEKGWGVYYEK